MPLNALLSMACLFSRGGCCRIVCVYTGVSARKMPVLLMRGQPQGRLFRPPSLHQIFSFSSQCRLILPDSALPVLRAPGTPASTVHIFAPKRFSWTMEPFLMSQDKASSLSDLRTCFSGSQKKKKSLKDFSPFLRELHTLRAFHRETVVMAYQEEKSGLSNNFLSRTF